MSTLKVALMVIVLIAALKLVLPKVGLSSVASLI